MSFNYSSDSLEDIHQCLMQTLVADFDYESAPRGKPIRELVAATFTLMDPRNRLVISPSRSANYGFGVGELCWYMRGDTDLATMTYYNKRMTQFSDDGLTINSAYGARIFNDVGWTHTSQFANVIEELRRDPESRRAVMHINQPGDLVRAVSKGSKDVPCTMSLQLFIRDRRLHMHALMRSNDIVWGLPYDVFSFTCLMELMMRHLQVAGVAVDDLGHYHHTVGSLHLYDTHFAMAGDVSREELVVPTPMKPIHLQEMEYLAYDCEPSIRGSYLGWASGATTDDPEDISRGYLERPSSPDDTTLDWMMSQLVQHRSKRVMEHRRQLALDELVRITEEAGGYPELSDKEGNA